MSGIVGIFNLDGEPVDRELLGRMTDYMTFRGPDTQQIWIEGNVGFGYTQLKTTWEMEYEHQPFTLDGQVWIVADARIDDRETLANKLDLPFQPLTGTPTFSKQEQVVPDVELILRAYLKWGEDCVQHLLGDFCFAIWDSRSQSLFCARDHFGIKLFYYSQIGNCLIVSNTLNCIRQHPKVSNELNEAAIGDFLLFDLNYNLETTTFADIKRLAPAYSLIYFNNHLKTQRYWTLSAPNLIRHKNSQAYIDQFRELMGQAVGDRLRTDKAGILFSGGLDSTTVAMNALDLARKRSQPLDLHAYTVVEDCFIPDEERYYSGIAANALDIPIHYIVTDNYELYEGWEFPELQTPEPMINPLTIIQFDLMKQLTMHSRVALNGHGGNESLKCVSVIESLKFMSPNDVLSDVISTFFNHHLCPPVGSGVFAFLKSLRKRDIPTYPTWLNPDFSCRLNLLERWNSIRNANLDQSKTFVRSSGLTSPLWMPGFENYDPGVTHFPVESRIPFFDLRLLNYFLALPPLPWCIDKYILRISMQNVLPPQIYRRPKTTPSYDRVCIDFSQDRAKWKMGLMHPSIKEYVDVNAILKEDPLNNRPYWNTWERIRAGNLGYWLTNVSNCS